MISFFELFKIGIGPSSSHTVGPMKAAAAFIEARRDAGELDQIARIVTTLYGSLAWTGKGHGTDKAVILGLVGELPATVDPEAADALVANVRARGWFQLPGFRQIAFDPKRDIIFDGTSPTPGHPNALEFRAVDAQRQFYPAYAQMDLRAGVKYDLWTANAFVTNVADKRGVLRGGLGSFFGLPVFNYIQPRTVGLSVSTDF